MKKFGVFVFLILLLLSFVSAGWFGDVFDGITGRVADDNTFTINLKQGWNVISFPIEPENPSIDSLFAGIDCKQIKTLSKSIVCGSPWGNLKELHAGEAFQVEMNSDGELVIVGMSSSGEMPAINEGWNLLGITSFSNIDIGEIIDENNLLAVYRYKKGASVQDKNNVSSASYEYYPRDFTMFESGKGYFVKSGTGECIGVQCICAEDWQCGEWDDCVDGEKARTCNELNNCGTDMNKPNTTQECISEEKNEFKITLKQGWNVISFPIEPENPSIDSLFAGIDCKQIKTLSKSIVCGSPWGNLKELHAGEAFQVEMNSDGELVIVGMSSSGEMPAINEGWNLLGITSFSDINISEIIDENNLLVVYRYKKGASTQDKNDASSAFYEYYPRDFTMFEAGKGYFVKSGTGKCITQECISEEKNEFSLENKKDISKYSDKEVFLISDKNWKDVLPLVPLTTWTQQEGDDSECQRGYGTPESVCVYPTLIYHEEETGFDADSIIYFMQQFSTEKVKIIGETPQELNNLLVAERELGAGLNQENIQRINVDNYLSYWESYKDIVYVEDDYELGLMASTYASLLNAPLIIQGTGSDKDENFEGRNVICVGDVDRGCDENYNLEELQKKYVEMTGTDKIILVNTDDLDKDNVMIREKDYLFPDKSNGPIKEIYTKSSLSAPLLAAAKHEILFSSPHVEYEYIHISRAFLEVDDFIEDMVGSLGIVPNYLTIIANPVLVPLYGDQSDIFPDKTIRGEVDNRIYADMGNDGSIEMGTGRIFGITISDVSAYIARDLFYSTIINGPNDYALLLQGPMDRYELAILTDRVLGVSDDESYNVKPSKWDELSQNYYWSDEINSVFGLVDTFYYYFGYEGGYVSIFYDKNHQIIENGKEATNNAFYLANHILHVAHGGPIGFSRFTNSKDLISDKAYLNSPIITSFACAVCSYSGLNGDNEALIGKDKLFCTQLLRRGAIGFFGSTANGRFSVWQDEVLNKLYLDRESLGNTIKYAKTINNDYINFNKQFENEILLGDPTIFPIFGVKKYAI